MKTVLIVLMIGLLVTFAVRLLLVPIAVRLNRLYQRLPQSTSVVPQSTSVDTFNIPKALVPMKACKNGDHNKERKFHFYINIYNAQTQDEGRYLYDVRTEGGRGGCPIRNKHY